MSSNFGIKISKDGSNVTTCANKDLAYNSNLDSLKISKTGSVYIDLPEEALSSTSKNYTSNYAHGLGYVPLFFPLVKNIRYDGNITTGTDWSLNDLAYSTIPNEGTITIVIDEIGTIEVGSTNLTLSVTRYDVLSTGITFGERRVTFNYIVFLNSAVDEFNLLP